MAHTTKDKEKLLNRVRRIKGQVSAIEKALEDDQECSRVLQTIAACRGAINGLMAEVMEGHVRYHLIDPTRKPTSGQAEAADELIDIVNRYLKQTAAPLSELFQPPHGEKDALPQAMRDEIGETHEPLPTRRSARESPIESCIEDQRLSRGIAHGAKIPNGIAA